MKLLLFLLLSVVILTKESIALHQQEPQHTGEAAFESEKVNAERFITHARLNISWSTLKRDVLSLDSPSNVMFIHATIGIFKKRRGKSGTWGHGTEILQEILQEVEESNALAWFRRIYIGTLGSKTDVSLAQATIMSQFASQKWNGKIEFIVSGESLELNEFPTLMILQLYANLIPESFAADSHLLYTHTKGVRQNGDWSSDWRRYLMHMLLRHYLDLCRPALSNRGYLTCGALKTPTPKGHIYAGNFWWAKGSYLQMRGDRIRELASTMTNRYVAENYLLQHVNSTVSRERHYCLHHTHHDMQNCPTPPEMYFNASKALQLRSHGDCYSRELRPKNQSKYNRTSWCHTVLPATH